ncbi:META domain-containing protein [Cerasicoccus arenae]|nr:META domain-containing protein [Cerasicoccus arenae]MBK1857245.1 META domain-containing protein [Cerasicoccus arenae]
MKHQRHFTTLLFLAFLGLLFTSGCASSKGVSRGEYVLISINGAAPEIGEVTLTLTDKDIYGAGPINLWQASVQFGKVGPMIVTRRGGPEHEMDFESKLVKSLEGSTMTEDGNTLVFTKGDMVVTFKPSGK